MWEIFAYGETPFADLGNHEVVALGLTGVRPPRPFQCPEQVWDLDPSLSLSLNSDLRDNGKMLGVRSGNASDRRRSFDGRMSATDQGYTIPRGLGLRSGA